MAGLFEGAGLRWEECCRLHDRDLAAALVRKYTRASQQLGWRFVLASRQRSRDGKTGDLGRLTSTPATTGSAPPSLPPS